jgi:hypothetical protein
MKESAAFVLYHYHDQIMVRLTTVGARLRPAKSSDEIKEKLREQPSLRSNTYTRRAPSMAIAIANPTGSNNKFVFILHSKY